MSDVVRVSANGRWAYLPVGSSAHQHLQRFASDGLAELRPSEVLLHSDAGPLFWELLDQKGQASGCPSHCLFALGDNSISILPHEELCFGSTDNGTYNEYADISWLNNPSIKPGLPIDNRGIGDGDIVLTAWPGDRSLLPAKAEQLEREMILTLVEPQSPGSRCFVLTEDGGALLTVGLMANGGDKMRIMPCAAMNSWLFSIGSKAAARTSSRFSVEDDRDIFIISDSKTNRKYYGSYKSDNTKLELDNIKIMLGHGGIGSILPVYQIKNYRRKYE